MSLIEINRDSELRDYPEDFSNWSQTDREAWFREEELLRKERQRLEDAQAKAKARKTNGSAYSHAKADIAELPEIDVASFAAVPAPDRAWHVPGLIPAKQVTLFGGDGKVGKSKLAMQLCVATAAEIEWLGMPPAFGPVIYVGAEDDIDEFHRRFEEIAANYGVGLDELPHPLILIPLAERDAVMAATVKQGRIAPTANWRGLIAKIVKHKPCLVVLDSLADFYAGSEINRSEARQFIALLRSVAILHALAAVLLAHPSLTGLQSGSGTSGSTAWSNSVRSRLALERLKDDQGKEIEPDRRLLKIMRSNYGPADKQIMLRWESGVWALDSSDDGNPFSTASAKAERIFLELLEMRNLQGRPVSENRSPTYAPRVFADHPDHEGVGAPAFAQAMERLLKIGRIKSEMFGRKSKERSRLVIVGVSESEVSF